MIERIIPAIYVEDLIRSRNFYCDLLELKVTFEADWIAQLSDPLNSASQLILQPRADELVPMAFQKRAQGISIVFVVPNSDTVYEKALSMDLKIIQKPKNEFYGQRRFMTVDPDGLLLDISSVCEPSPEFKAKYFGG